VAKSPDRNPRKTITLKEIAEAAHVSRMTVSLALRNHPSLPAATSRRIQTLAHKMGYRPDPDISKLMEKIRSKKLHGEGNVIAYMTAYQEQRGWWKEYTQRMYYEGAYERADLYGYRLEEFRLGDADMTEERLSKIIRHRGIDGVLIAPLPQAAHLYRSFRWDFFSCVELGYSLLSPELHRTCNHQFNTMMLLMEKLVQAGYRRIGLAMSGDQDERVNHNWRAGYLAGCSIATGVRPLAMLLPATWTRDAFARWFERHTPDVIVTVGGDVYGWMLELGMKIPGEVGVANVDLSDKMGGITGINQNSRNVGAAAVDLLTSLMRVNERGIPSVPTVLKVQGNYVQGETTRPLQGV
jgi:LacI family transcriptional regulator